MELKPIELRVLGVLIEKSMTNPDTYPITLNALTLGCNQKTNREPVMNVTEGEVAAALHELQNWRLASLGDTQRGARSNRFQHDVEKRFGWNAAQRAIMAELMLRGPQTLGELRARASRMAPLGDGPFLSELLKELQTCDPPMAVELSRLPGQSTTRWAQLLGGRIESAELPLSVPTREGELMPEELAAHAALEARIDALAAEVARLREEFRQFTGRPASQ